MSFDLPVSLYIQNHLASPLLDRFFSAVTALGNFGIFWILMTAVLLIIKSTRPIGLACLMALIIDYAVVEAIKALVGRLRPFQAYPIELIIAAPSGSSFPSAHSSIAFAVATAYFTLAKHSPGKWIRWGVLLLACLIAYSRVYLFVHYSTDILAGALIGVLIGYLCARFVQSRVDSVVKPDKFK